MYPAIGMEIDHSKSGDGSPGDDIPEPLQREFSLNKPSAHRFARVGRSVERIMSKRLRGVIRKCTLPDTAGSSGESPSRYRRSILERRRWKDTATVNVIKSVKESHDLIHIYYDSHWRCIMPKGHIQQDGPTRESGKG